MQTHPRVLSTNARTLRHCNLLKFGYNFMEGLDNVQNLYAKHKGRRQSICRRRTHALLSNAWLRQ
jgi:hypothetical protein